MRDVQTSSYLFCMYVCTILFLYVKYPVCAYKQRLFSFRLADLVLRHTPSGFG